MSPAFFLFLDLVERQRKEDRKRAPTCWFTVQMPTKPGKGQSQEWTTQSRSLTKVAGAHLFWLSPLPPMVCIDKLESGTRATNQTLAVHCGTWLSYLLGWTPTSVCISILLFYSFFISCVLVSCYTELLGWVSQIISPSARCSLWHC